MSVKGREWGGSGGGRRVGAAAMERGLLLELSTEGVVGGTAGTPGDAAAYRGADRRNPAGPRRCPLGRGRARTSC